MRPTILEINTAQIRENLRKIKDSLPEYVTSTAVIKANGYGHGSVMVGRIAVEEGYEAVAVAFPEEAKPLRDAGITVPIYLLGLSLPQSFDTIVETRSIPAICESTDLDGLNECAVRHQVEIDCSIAVDTGMHRIGVAPEHVLEFMDKVNGYSHLRVEGFFSHLANGDAADQTHANMQAKIFRDVVHTIKEQRGDHYRFSLANSAGLLVVENSLLNDAFNDSRPGIIQYGIMPSMDVPNRLGLRPALSFFSKVVHVQHLKSGESIGYGSTFTTTSRHTTIATIPVGYADGYPRTLSNRGHVLIHGRRCPIVGRICMDQLMVEVPPGVLCQPGDDVVLIGTQGNESITVLEVAYLVGTIPYEIFCNFSERVPRVYVEKPIV